MKKISKRLIALLLTVIMASGTVVSADAGSDIKAAKNAAIAARDSLAKYEKNLASLTTQRTETNTKKNDAKKLMNSRLKTYQSAVNSAKSSSEFKKIQNAYDKVIEQERSIETDIEMCKMNIHNYKNAVGSTKEEIEEAVDNRRKEIIKDYNKAMIEYNNYETSKKEVEKAIKSCDEKIKDNQALLEKYKPQLKTAQANYDAAAVRYNEGMFGFLEWQQTAYPKYADDARRALNILNNCREAKYNIKGDPKNATAILGQIDYLEKLLNKCNKLRQNDPNYNKKGEVLKVNSVAMAIAQSNANYTRNAHSNPDKSNVDGWGVIYTDQFPVAQIMSTCYDPYESWYDTERKIWEEKKDNWEFCSGHYTVLMEWGNPNTATGIANSNGRIAQIFIPEWCEFANGPLIPISEYFSMLREYNALVYPEELAKKLENIQEKIYKAENNINVYKSNKERFKKDVDKYQSLMDNALAEAKKKQGYKTYKNMDKELDKVRAEFNNEIKENERKIKNLNAELEQLQADLANMKSTVANARKTYESKLKNYPDVEKAFKSYISAQETYNYNAEKLEKLENKIENLKEQIKSAKEDYNSKLAAYKKILKDNGLSYEDNKLEDPSAKDPVKTITLKAKTSNTIMAGKQVQIAATIKPANASQKLTWTSSNKSYATVNSNGLVTTKPAGAGKTVVIRATATDGSKKTNTIKLKIVKDGVTSIALKGNTSVKAGGSTKITATVKASGKTANTELGWKSSNKDFASVSPDGVVYANEAGKGETVTITAYSLDGTGIKKSIKISIG